MFIKMRESKGFTLVELMIVVAIIGILAAVAVPYYQRYVAKSRLTSKVMPAVHSIETSIGTYFAVRSALPTISTNDDLMKFTSDADTTFITLDGTSFDTTGQIEVTVLTDATDDNNNTPFAAIGTENRKNVFYMDAKTSGGSQKLYWYYSGTLAEELGL